MTTTPSSGQPTDVPLPDMVAHCTRCERPPVAGRRTTPDSELDPETVAIGQRIRAARDAVGIAQAALAEKIGVKAHTLWRYEAGRMRPGSEAIVGISRELGVSPHFLLHGTPPPESRVEQDVPESFRIWREHIAPEVAPGLTPAVEARMLETKFRYPPQDAPRWTIIYHEVLAEMRGRLVASQEQATRELTEQARTEANEVGLMKPPPKKKRNGR